MAHARRISTQKVVTLQDGWRIYLTEPNAVLDPSGLAPVPAAPVPGTAPGTVVSALRDAGSAALKHKSPDDFDAWYQVRFEADVPAASETVQLVFEGLATIADVWLNGEHLLRSENMYLRHEIDVTAPLRPQNELCIRFSSLNRFLEQRRPRPHWRTKLVDHPQLRWVRTTLVGRMPGWHEWAHCVHAVGPWRPVSLVYDHDFRLETADVRTSLVDGEGLVQASLGVRLPAGELSEAFLQAGEQTAPLQVTKQADGRHSLDGLLRFPGVAQWWPHTHGAQPLYAVSVRLLVDGRPVEIDFGRTGFRSIHVDQKDGGFSVEVNGEPIFMRGACWTAADAASLVGEDHAYDHLLGLAREAGMNMLRIPGTGFYESDTFYDRCAELGITVWQDFSFAVMDYPSEDPAFGASVSAEAHQLLDRLQLNPALAVLCGNSDCEASAAMHGLTAAQRQNLLFEDILPQVSRVMRPDVPYVPSSQWGGALPFHVDQGVSHFYGVGAYLRPPDDARRSGVRFATECLGFSNIPEDETIDTFLAEGESPGHHPSWNAGIPRNVGQGWDFGDVQDHYTQLLLGEDPKAAMYSDANRYLALGRLVHGELMAAAFAEWRRPASRCQGALLWFFRDLWPCAGWGVIDACDLPKSVFYYLKRALSPLALFFSDEGMSGLRLHVINEQPSVFETDLRIAFYRHGHTCIHQQSLPIRVAARGAVELNVDEVVGHFMDTTYAYRFGPPAQDVIYAALGSAPTGLSLPRAFHFPTGLSFPKSADLGLHAQASSCGGGRYELAVRAARFAQAVRIDTRGYQADDNYFHLEPGGERTVILSPTPSTTKSRGGRSFYGDVTAFNALAPTKINFSEDRF